MGGPLLALKAPMRMGLFRILQYVFYPSRLYKAQTLHTSAIANTSSDPGCGTSLVGDLPVRMIRPATAKLSVYYSGYGTSSRHVLGIHSYSMIRSKGTTFNDGIDLGAKYQYWPHMHSCVVFPLVYSTYQNNRSSGLSLPFISSQPLPENTTWCLQKGSKWCSGTPSQTRTFSKTFPMVFYLCADRTLTPLSYRPLPIPSISTYFVRVSYLWQLRVFLDELPFLRVFTPSR